MRVCAWRTSVQCGRLSGLAFVGIEIAIEIAIGIETVIFSFDSDPGPGPGPGPDFDCSNMYGAVAPRAERPCLVWTVQFASMAKLFRAHS